MLFYIYINIRNNTAPPYFYINDEIRGNIPFGGFDTQEKAINGLNFLNIIRRKPKNAIVTLVRKHGKILEELFESGFYDDKCCYIQPVAKNIRLGIVN
tara:strand:+ start:302 stop:595 length:294 start_codon:yes stop_codon:yes gene_type:complete